MSATLRRARLRRLPLLLLVVLTAAGSALIGAPSAQAVEYASINGTGSSWAANAVTEWISNGQKFGWKVTYGGFGSTRGRTDFLNKQVDFAVSDIPFQFNPTDGSVPERPAAGSYAYMPVVAGGTSFMYNLKIGGRQVTNLRLSGANIARIFTGQISTWNDPRIAADNPGLTLPGTKVVPVVRADGSGSSAQFSLWMENQYPSIWHTVYNHPPTGETSIWPAIKGGQPKVGDDGVANYISQAYGDGAIGYVQYSYAKNKGFPVAKMLNRSGYYVEPTAYNVAVALTKAQIQTKNPSDLATYLTQQLDGVYSDTDPRTYPLSAYSYMILPLTKTTLYSDAKAATLGAFGKYLLCDGQARMGELGYSPLPINLVQAGFAQLKKSPGVNAGALNVAQCKNPTFTTGGQNRLAQTAPQPAACDKQGPTQCSTGTGGAKASTPVKSSARGSGSGGGTGSTGGAGGTGGSGGGTGTGRTGGTGAAGTGGGTGTTGTAGGGGSVDPDTGLVQGGTGDGGDVPLAGPVSLNRSTDTGWSGSQTFAVLGILLLVAVFVLPPLVVKRLSGGAK